MGKKRKQKPSKEAAEKLMLARSRNDLMKKLRKLCGLIGDEKWVDYLPDHSLHTICNFRLQLKVVSPPGKKIPKQLATIIEQGLKQWMQETDFEVIKGSGKTMNMADFYRVGPNLQIALARAEFKEKHLFDEFCGGGNKDFGLELLEKILVQAWFYGWHFADLRRHHLYAFDYDVKSKSLSQPGKPVGAYFRYLLVMSLVDMEPKNFIIDDEVHIAYPIPIAFCNNIGGELHKYNTVIKWKASDVFAKPRVPEEEMQIFIQQHALDRMYERTGAEEFGNVLYDCVTFSLVAKKEVTRLPGKRLLIAFYMRDLKLGYFLASIIGNEILIRTFLLITHEGTPEGKRLEELTGLKKEDIKFLRIDNLQAMVSSDILDNEEVCNIFREAGLGVILELSKEIREAKDDEDTFFCWLTGKPNNDTSLSKAMLDYLRTGVDSDEMVEISDD